MKLRKLTDVFMMKIMFAVGITAGLAVGSAAGCDGPVLTPGSSVNTCGPCSTNSPTCPGFTSVRNDYYHCGGSGFTYCSQSNQTVGQSHMPCSTSTDMALWTRMVLLYQDCLTDQKHNDPSRTCPYPDICVATTCSAGTAGGYPIVFAAVSDLGDYDGCMLAKLQKSPSPSVVELALVVLGEHGG
jgi:hypothetical protein